MAIDKKLVKKYLDYKGIDGDFDLYIDEVFLEVKNISNPKKICVISNCFVENGYYKLDNLGLVLKSDDINKLFIN